MRKLENNIVATVILTCLASCADTSVRSYDADDIAAHRAGLITLIEQRYFKPSSTSGGTSLLFGESVSMARDGAYAIVGNPGNRTFDIYNNKPAGWSLEDSLLGYPFGSFSPIHSASAISGDGKIIIAGSNDYSINVGHVEIREKRAPSTPFGSSWARTGLFGKAGPSSPSNYFGYSVALSGNGKIALIGDPGFSAGWPGDISLYRRSELDGKVTWDPAGTLRPSIDLHRFGYSLGIADDGAVVAVSAEYLASSTELPRSSVYIYELFGDLTVARTFHLVPDDSVHGDSANSVISISADGKTVVLGVPSRKHTDLSGRTIATGVAYVFNRTDVSPGWRQVAKLVASDAEMDNFGAAVDISADGRRIIIGAPNEGDISGRYGAAYVFETDGTSWKEHTKIRASNKTDGAQFGASVALSHNGYQALVSAPARTYGMVQQYVYELFLLRSNGDYCRAGNECASGYCVDGVCCDRACGGSDDDDCQVCSKAKGAMADGQCSLRGAATVCRPSRGVCDVAELCSGTSPACPADSRAPRSTVCRPAAGPCDLDDYCDGASVTCPAADTKRAAGTVCRTEAGICDVAETCDGSSSLCPAADIKKTAGTLCRPAAGVCDAAEVCNGSDVTCPADIKKLPGAVCRGSAGVCDVAEQCTGKDDTCPNDMFAPSTMICRPTAAACMEAAACTGKAAGCPANRPKPKGTPCGGGTDPICDPGNTCDGVGMCIELRAKDATPCKLSSGKDGICKLGTCVP